MKAEQLRKSILQLAIQGKLVPQDPNDEPASVLLERIREEKQKLIKEGKIKKDKIDSVIYKGEDNRYYEKVGSEVKDITDELPFEIPDSWAWCRLQTICSYIHRGKSPKYGSDKILPIIAQKCNQWTGIQTQKCLFADRTTIDKYAAEQYLRVGDIIINSTGTGTVGRTNYVFIDLFKDYPKFVADSHVTVVRTYSHIYSKYIYQFLKSPIIQTDIEAKCSGSTNQIELATKTIQSYLIPLPPFREQQKIVMEIEKFEPLIAEYDKLEQQATKLDDEIYDKLKKSILQYAIQGKLVPQDPNDEPASVLLERIRVEKKAKLGKKYVDSYIYKGDDNYYYEHIAGREQDDLVEVPFDIPDNWAWVRWGNLSFSIQYGYNAPAKESGRIKMVRISDIHNNEVDWEHVPFCDINETDIKTYLLKENDILFARTGGTVGKSYLVTCVPEEAIYAGYLIRTQYSAQLSAQYLKYFMESSLYWMQLKDGTIATAQPNCNGQTLSKMILPLPPLAEQKRIVAKINEIFATL